MRTTVAAVVALLTLGLAGGCKGRAETQKPDAAPIVPSTGSAAVAPSQAPTQDPNDPCVHYAAIEAAMRDLRARRNAVANKMRAATTINAQAVALDAMQDFERYATGQEERLRTTGNGLPKTLKDDAVSLEGGYLAVAATFKRCAEASKSIASFVPSTKVLLESGNEVMAEEMADIAKKCSHGSEATRTAAARSEAASAASGAACPAFDVQIGIPREFSPRKAPSTDDRTVDSYVAAGGATLLVERGCFSGAIKGINDLWDAGLRQHTSDRVSTREVLDLLVRVEKPGSGASFGPVTLRFALLRVGVGPSRVQPERLATQQSQARLRRGSRARRTGRRRGRVRTPSTKAGVEGTLVPDPPR